MRRFLLKWSGVLVTAGLFLPPCLWGLPAVEQPVQVKELNLVFLHGMGGTTCSLQLLSDYVNKRLTGYVYLYEQSHPGTTIEVNILGRCYPAYTDIRTWANNLADSINKNFKDRDNLIIIGHSMGGKTALYSVAHNVGGLGDKVSAVITINSPVKDLGRYYAPGGGPVLNYCRTGLLGSDQGVCSSLTYYDASKDGAWVAENRHWLAFISGENAPISPQFDRAGVDGWPRDMDDGIVPISAMYADGADVAYYGEQGHSAIGSSPDVADYLADQILRYIFGLPIECCALSKSGTFGHEADWLLGKDQWDEVVGEIAASEGTVMHRNDSFTSWQEWEDVVGELPADARRSSSLIQQVSLPVLTSVKEVRWLTPGEPADGRIYVRTGAAPLSTVKVQWTIYQVPLLPAGTKRAYYEVNIRDGTPLVGVTMVEWSSRDSRDLRLRIQSEAHSPFRWFKAEWRVYYMVSLLRNIIQEIPAK